MPTDKNSNKKKYDVYFCVTHDTASWNGKVTTKKYFVGSTMAISKKQAVNNVRFRASGKGYNHWAEDMGCDTAAFYDYVAYEQ